jgi:hypothetical protein
MTDPTPAAPAAPKAGLAEDFVDIFVSPREVFARRANSGFFAILLIVTVLIGGLFLINRGTLADIMDAETTRAMAEAMKSNPQMTDAQMAAGKKVAGYMTTVGVFVGIPITLMLIGLTAWLTVKALGAQISYTAATMIASYAYLPRVIEALTVSVQGLLLDTSVMTGRYQLTWSAARFLDPEMSPGLLGLAGRVDLFTIWVTALIAIGLSAVAKLPRDKAIAAGAIVWALGAIPALWQFMK